MPSSSISSGDSHFGPYAGERCMPATLLAALHAEPFVSTARHDDHSNHNARHVHRDALAQLAAVLARDPTVETVHLAASPLHHFHDTPAAHCFCGYRNAQTLLHAYLQRNPPAPALGARVPNIPALQRLIDAAQPGGSSSSLLVDTRRWIGTPEVSKPPQQSQSRAVHRVPAAPAKLAALLAHQAIPHRCARLTPQTHTPACAAALQPCSARAHLTQHLVSHFRAAAAHDNPAPPVYLQWAGHSVTVVGVALRRCPPPPPPRRSLLSRLFGRRLPAAPTTTTSATPRWEVLILDPSVHSGTALRRAAQTHASGRHADAVLRRYTLDSPRTSEFEVLTAGS